MNLHHFLAHDEHYGPDGPGQGGIVWVAPPKMFTCAGCGQRRSADEGCAGDDLLSRACDYCVVATWDALALMGRAIALRQFTHEGRPTIRPARRAP